MRLRKINTKSDQMLYDAEAIPIVFELFYDDPKKYNNNSCVTFIDEIANRFFNFSSKIEL